MGNEKEETKKEGFFRNIFGHHRIMQKSPEEVDEEFQDIFEESRNNPVFEEN